MKNEACVFSCSGFKIKTFHRDLSKSVLIASVFYCSSQQSSQQSSHDDDSSRFLSPHMRDDRYVCSCSTRGNSWKHSVKSDGLGWLRPHFPSVSQLFNQKCHILKKAWLNRSYQCLKKAYFSMYLKVELGTNTSSPWRSLNFILRLILRLIPWNFIWYRKLHQIPSVLIISSSDPWVYKWNFVCNSCPYQVQYWDWLLYFRCDVWGQSPGVYSSFLAAQ